MSARSPRAAGMRRRPARYTDRAPSAALREALHAHRKGDLAAAAAGYLRALDDDPDDLDARVNLGAVWTARGRCDDARRTLTQAAAHPAADARALRDVGMSLAALGHFTLARAVYARAHALDPRHVGVLLAWSRASGEDGAPDALDLARRATALAPEDPGAWIARYRAALDLAAAAEADASVAQAAAWDPGPVGASLLAAHLAGEGRVDEARRALDARTLPAGLDAAVRWRCDHPATPTFGARRAGLVRALDAAPRAGAVLEFGVRYGLSARVLAAHTDRVVHGFDSFEGLPLAWGALPPGAFTMERHAPELPANVALHVGRFDETLPGFVAAMREAPALIHVDSDLYESARTVLRALGPRVPAGCVLLFDEYLGNEAWRDDEHRAWTECAAAFGWRAEVVGASLVTGQVALRVLG
ncbi:MAG: class I SAM-dependent methyltransferase [Polyangiales bacterium]